MTDRDDVVYGAAGGRELKCDLLLPKGPSQRTAVIQLHGGGFRMGDRKMLRPQSQALSALGFTCIAAEYRLLGEAPWPAQIHDAKAAIRWARANAGELGVEPGRIVVQGFSAGAYLGLVAAGNAADLEGESGTPGVSSKVDALIALYPPSLFFHDAEGAYSPPPMYRARADGALPAGVLLEGASSPETAEAISPLKGIGPGYPPTALWHGGADDYVPPMHSLRIYEALIAAGVKADLHILARAWHAFDFAPSLLDSVQRDTALFLRRVLTDTPAITTEYVDSMSNAPPAFVERIRAAVS